jgi:hypothetical protein
MAYSDTSIIIHLVKDASALNLDDMISIKKNLEDCVFEITYKDQGDPLRHKAYQMSRDHVCDYVYLLLKNLTLDEDGYQKIQFSMPAMPRVIINASNLKDLYYRSHFLELVENGLTMLDKVEKLTIKKPVEMSFNDPCNNCPCPRPVSASSRNGGYSWPDLPHSPVHTYFQ